MFEDFPRRCFLYIITYTLMQRKTIITIAAAMAHLTVAADVPVLKIGRAHV